ncbi:class I SAM-dependent methyltransferase [Algoriphagus litoralis]|uniref:class I SAM-dependent methyltransferase n=1 Tax=Algoriphagus litoralis TaxID=2202829 RepID=UPI000DB92218|nr:class I SAM-dependent methyltransferase [Algoriphagus litoralis]
MKEFWNSWYSAEDFAYGILPNHYFATQILELNPGKALFPAEGEGRNAVFAAEKGWEVSAFDSNEEDKAKAERLAKDAGVQISYAVAAVDEYSTEKESINLLALIFAHFPAESRQKLHPHLVQFLRPGGKLILEAFS